MFNMGSLYRQDDIFILRRPPRPYLKSIIYDVHWQSYSLQWRHNGRDGVSNHRRLDRLLNRLFRRGSKKTSKLRVIGLYEVAGEFPAQRASNGKCFHLMTSSWMTSSSQLGSRKMAAILQTTIHIHLWNVLCILIHISPKYVPRDPINNETVLVQIMACEPIKGLVN